MSRFLFRPAPLLWLLLAVTVLVYYPGLSGRFLFDDKPNIVDNTTIHIEDLSFETLRIAALSSEAGPLRRPVSMLSLAFNRYFLGTSALAFKSVNLAIHLLNGIAIFLLLARLLEKELPDWRERQQAALFTAALWLLHPLNLTPALYVIQRMASLSALFTLYGCLYYLWLRRRRREEGGYLPALLGGTFFFLVMGALSKENGLLLPLFLFLLEWVGFAFRDKGGQVDRGILLFFSLFLFIPGVLGGAWLVGRLGAIEDTYATRAFTLEERLLTQTRVVLFYLRLILIPTPGQLGIYHDDIPLSHGLLDPPTTLMALGAMALLLGAAIRWTWKGSLVGMGILWFFVGHLMESTLLPLEIAHEHRNYLGDMGILMGIALLALRRDLLPALGNIRRFALWLFLLLLTAVTAQRAISWGDYLHVLDEARHHPNSIRASFEAARLKANLVLFGHSQDGAGVLADLERVSHMDQESILPEVTAFLFTFKRGETPADQWFERARDKLAHAPFPDNSIVGLQSLNACQREGVCKLSNEQLNSLYESALANPLLTYNRPLLRMLYAEHRIYGLQDAEGALTLLLQAVDEAPKQPRHRLNLAHLFLHMGNVDGARQAVEEGRDLDRFGLYVREIRKLEEAMAAVKAAP